MGRHLGSRTIAALFLATLFIAGCQGNRGSSSPDGMSNNGFNSDFGGGSLGGGGPLTPAPSVPSTPEESVPGLPGLDEDNADPENPANLPQGTDLSSFLGQFQNAWSSIFNRQTPFDPRSLPQVGQNAFRDWFCRAAALNGLRALYGGTSVAEFVADLYVRVLRRAPDTPGLNHHVGDLVAGRTTVRQKVRQFILSDEHLKVQVVQGNYRHFLGRDAREDERIHWAHNLLRHHDDQLHNPYNHPNTLETFQAKVAASPEFFRNRSGNNPRSQVINMYRFFLARWPAEWEIQWWLNGRNYYDHGTRINVAIGFVTSDEYRLTWIHRVHKDYLGRNPTGGEVQAMLARFHSGSDMFREMTNLLVGLSYFQRVNTLWNAFYSQQYCSQQN